MDHYIALIHPPEGSSGFGVTFPDLPGCVSVGTTFEDACRNAQEALSGHVAALLADDEQVAPARTLAELRMDADVVREIDEGAVPALVPLSDVPAPKERINVTFDRWLLRRIDEHARAIGLSRSAFLEQSARRALVEGVAPD
jgi:predicted RNase H-like HicB family nuclease